MKTKARNDVNELADYLKTISDPNRLKILTLLAEGERCVCEIHRPLDIPQNLTSHHLKALKEASLVISRKEGKWVHYSLNIEKLLYYTDLYALVLLGSKA